MNRKLHNTVMAMIRRTRRQSVAMPVFSFAPRG